uniref:WIYLD domain-containing protein n=1 Tax=Triticum urartu TaxID=4572 RepID=A0A8R7R838_TRIUA
MPRRRPRAGEKRMDAAIDHFAEMGYRKADVRRVVNKLLKDVYGKDGWPLLEDSCYSVVQEALFELEEQEKLQQQQNEDDDGDDEGEEAHLVRALSTYSLVSMLIAVCAIGTNLYHSATYRLIYSRQCFFNW